MKRPDAGALEALYRRRFDDFVRVPATITRDPTLAHDAVQDAFANALRRRGAFRGDAPLEAWMWRVVINAARDARRRRTDEPVSQLPERGGRRSLEEVS